MTPRSHLWLRLGAVALLAAAALWPRGSRAGMTAADVVRATSYAAATHGVAARAETTAARLVSAPPMGKVVVADADESKLNN